MKRISKLSLIISFVLSTAYAFVMPSHAQTESDCAARADRVARESSVAKGAAIGGAGGGVIGAIVSSKSSKGFIQGAAIGAVAGGATKAYKKDQAYKRAYDDCMAGR